MAWHRNKSIEEKIWDECHISMDEHLEPIEGESIFTPEDEGWQ